MWIRQQKGLPILTSHEREYEQIRAVFNRVMADTLQGVEDGQGDLRSVGDVEGTEGQELGRVDGAGSDPESEDRRGLADAEVERFQEQLIPGKVPPPAGKASTIILATPQQAEKFTTALDAQRAFEKSLTRG